MTIGSQLCLADKAPGRNLNRRRHALQPCTGNRAAHTTTITKMATASEWPDFKILEPDCRAMVLQRNRPGRLGVQEHIPDRGRRRPPFGRVRESLLGSQ